MHQFRPWLLRLHRWTMLVLAVPTAAIILSGLVLAFEPALNARQPVVGPDTLRAVTDAINDLPSGSARAISVDPGTGIVTVQRAGGDPLRFDLVTAAPVRDGREPALFRTARQIHERLLFDLGWLVTLSSWGMLAAIALGVLIGWPRFRNSLSGWHKGVGWVLLPLLVLSPATGLMLAYGVTFTPARERAEPVPPNLARALALASEPGGLGAVSSIRQRGRAGLVVRRWEGGELRSYAVGSEGLVAQPRNWPRLLHEGNWWGLVSSGANVVTALAMVLLLVTGVTPWGRRQFRRRRSRVSGAG